MGKGWVWLGLGQVWVWLGLGQVWVLFSPFPRGCFRPGAHSPPALPSIYLSGTRSGGAGRGDRMNRILFRLQGTHDRGPGEKKKELSKPGVGF